MARALLLPVLDAVLFKKGYLEPADVEAAAREAGVPLAQAWEVVDFYPRYRLEPPKRRWLLVDDPVSRIRGFDRLRAALEEVGRAAGLEVGVLPSQGLEALAPALIVEEGPRQRAFAPVDEATIRALLKGRTPENEIRTLPWALAKNESPLFEVPEALPAFPGAEALIEAVRASGLRGLGGALFPTWRKLAAVRAARGEPKYVVVNGDESEPGNFKDRWLMEHNPRLVWIGAALAARTVGAEAVFFYVRGEYEAALEAVEAERQALEAEGYFEGLKTQTFRGGGLYICGEESALLESIEGKRAEPRLKPPYPAEVGLFGKPTLVNNVETLAHLALIVIEGLERYAALRPKLFSVSGDVESPGVYAFPLGTPLGAVLKAAGAEPETTRAVLMAGAAGTFVDARESWDLPLDYDAPRRQGDAIGPGALVAFNRDRDLWPVLEGIAAFFAHESCGKCFPCSLGTPHLAAFIGERRVDDALFELMEALEAGSLCGLGQAAPWALKSFVRRFLEVRA